MLDMGFAEDIEAILDATPDRPPDRAVLGDDAAAHRRHRPAPPARPGAHRDRAGRRRRRRPRRSSPSGPTSSTRAHKPAALGRILDVEAPAAAIVFCRTRTEVDQLTETLNGRGYRAEALHGGMNQEGRDRVMGRLRNGTAELLIATDVAARGLDVDLLTHVINYDVPSAPDAYVHRIGRVGRAGREGVAITLAEPRELRLLGNIERATGRPIPIEQVPSVADLRARQLEATTGAAARGAGRRRPRPLQRRRRRARPSEADVRDVARAAIKLVHEARTSAVDEVEIPEFVPRDRPSATAATGQARARRRAPRWALPGRAPRPGCSSASAARTASGPATSSAPSPTSPTSPASDIGPINIADNFSTVDVPAARRRRRDRRHQADDDPGQAADDPPRPPPALTTGLNRSRRSADAASRRPVVAAKSTENERSGSAAASMDAVSELSPTGPGAVEKPSASEPLRPLLVVAGMLGRDVGRRDHRPACRARRSTAGASGRAPSAGLVGIPLAPFLHCGLRPPVRQHDPVPRARRVHRHRRPQAVRPGHRRSSA